MRALEARLPGKDGGRRVPRSQRESYPAAAKVSRTGPAWPALKAEVCLLFSWPCLFDAHLMPAANVEPGPGAKAAGSSAGKAVRSAADQAEWQVRLGWPT